MTTFIREWNLNFTTTAQQIFKTFPQKRLNQLSKYLIERNGLDFQISICMEEISELATELVLDSSFENTSAEIADVIISLNHVTTGYNINAFRTKKIAQPEFMAGNKDRLLTLLDLQKELMKHTNRKKENMDTIIEKTADAYVVLARLIINLNNLPLVQKTMREKIQRTYLRQK